MVTVVQLVERLVVIREVAGSSPVSHPNVSHGVDGRVRKTPNLDRLVRFGVFCCYRAEKWALSEGVWCCFAPGLDETDHHAFNRVVSLFCVHRARSLLFCLLNRRAAPSARLPRRMKVPPLHAVKYTGAGPARQRV